MSPVRPREPIPGSRTLSHHAGPSVENFQSSPRKTHLRTTKATPPTNRRTISPKEVARAALAPNSQALPGAERAAGARRGKGSPWWAYERPRRSLRRAYEASSPSSRARAAQLPLRLPAPRVLQAARTTKQAVGQPHPWSRPPLHPSTTASPSSGSASTRPPPPPSSSSMRPSTPASTASRKLWKGPRPGSKLEERSCARCRRRGLPQSRRPSPSRSRSGESW